MWWRAHQEYPGVVDVGYADSQPSGRPAVIANHWLAAVLARSTQVGDRLVIARSPVAGEEEIPAVHIKGEDQIGHEDSEDGEESGVGTGIGAVGGRHTAVLFCV